MVEVAMTSNAFEKFQSNSKDTAEQERRTVEMTTNIDDVEDGELPEEGEICEDDDVKDAKSTFQARLPIANESPVRGTSSLASASPRRPRDYDREETSSSQGGEGLMLNSWMTGVKQRVKTGGVSGASASPTIDANEEYYGYGSVSPRGDAGDKDYRNHGDESTDKDYRWGSIRAEETGRMSAGHDSTNEYGDCDYRSDSPRMDRRRRRSPSPPYSKRARCHTPPSRGGYRGRGCRGRWGERQICKFFREGYCRDGENCSYSHEAADSGRKPELCKFYQQGYCKKGLQCPLLHGEYPCKAFHKGECSRDPCQFSHVPLTSYTQQIFDQMIKDDELASRITIPPAPLKRRVLLPGGPVPGASPGVVVSPTNSSSVETVSGGVLPPPSVVVPTLSSAPPIPISQPQLIIPPPLVGPRPQFPTFFPHHVLSSSAETSTSMGVATVSSSDTPLAVSQFAPGVAVTKTGEVGRVDEEPDTSFNINKMLEQITSKAKQDNEMMEESPASPPMFMSEEVSDAPMIPQVIIPLWRLVPVDNIVAPHSNLDSAILQNSLTDSNLRNDPRIKKALSSQFDEFTNSLIKAAPQSSLQAVSTSANVSPLPNVAVRDDTQGGIKPVDPRSVAARDPRKRPSVIDPRVGVGCVSDPRLAAAVSKPNTVKLPSGSMNGFEKNVHDSQVASTSVAANNCDQLYSSTVGMNQSPIGADPYNSPQHRREERSYYDGRRGGAPSSSWMPQIQSNLDPRQNRSTRFRDPVNPYRTETLNKDKDDREVTNKSKMEVDCPSPTTTQTEEVSRSPTSAMSLREKRKNNEYESPLSRIAGGARWGAQ
ncbi:hypothetical protein AB6A40_004758 [Gnathostoma spinigerum]|uniref:C3H1-type domain-containing protein n=1 Tax=Gnathostoma spinigerum TaxID=75299 RepID=A0ABD6EL50_9BILA